MRVDCYFCEWHAEWVYRDNGRDLFLCHEHIEMIDRKKDKCVTFRQYEQAKVAKLEAKFQGDALSHDSNDDAEDFPR